MTADYRTQAIQDPTTVVQELFQARAVSAEFPRLVAQHFAKLFESAVAFKRIPTLDVRSPPEVHRDRALVRFRAMVQDTSLSTEMYLAKHSDGTCGGWGMYEAAGGSSSHATDVDYANLQECSVLWATNVPAESGWCADELDSRVSDDQSPPSLVEQSIRQRTHKYPHAESRHIGVQVKIYGREGIDTFKSTDVVTFVGILSKEPCNLDQAQDAPPDVPTLHVLFTKPHGPGVLPRPFPRMKRQIPAEYTTVIPEERPDVIAPDTGEIRRELICWIAEEALGGDQQAAEWILLSCISRVQSRNPPLLPLPLVVSRYPPPPPVPSTSATFHTPVPTLSTVLSLLLPLTYTLSLSLDGLNKAMYTPESKDEDLHAGVLQLPQGTVLLVSEGGVREGQLLERGLLNVRALQEVMDAQTLAYVFPFSQYSFPTDITCVILAEGRRSAFFKTELNVPLNVPTDPASVARLYKPAAQVRMPSADRLAAFRDLVVGARCGRVQVSEATSEHIQAAFVQERRDDRNITADDLIRWMSVAKLYALSIHEPTLSIETWKRAKAFDDRRRALGA